MRMKLNRCRFSPVLIFPLLLLFSSPAWPGPAPPPSVRIDGDRIWIRAERVPLQSILRKVDGYGVRVRIDPNLNPEITADIENREIRSGISLVLKSVNHVLIWESIPQRSDPIPRLAEIQVFEPGKKFRMIDLTENDAFEILKDPAEGFFYVKDEILIRLKPDADLSELIHWLEKIGGTVLGRNPASAVYRIGLPENSDLSAVRKRIVSLPGVSEAEPNYAYPLLSPTPVLDTADAAKDASKPEFEEDLPAIAIFDSGISSEAGLEDLIVGSLNAVDPGDSAADSLGHGTQMAYIACGRIKPKGVDKDAGGRIPILPVKIFDKNGYTSSFSVLEGVAYAIENGAAVISLSWGAETKSRFLEETLKAADEKGLIAVASAGNRPTGKPVYPAAYPTVIGVGALTPDGKVWENSNYGDFVTLYAPGFGDFPVGYKGDPGSYAGTSISAAFAANIIADYLSKHPGAEKKEVLEMIRERSKKPSDALHSPK